MDVTIVNNAKMLENIGTLILQGYGAKDHCMNLTMRALIIDTFLANFTYMSFVMVPGPLNCAHV